MAPNRADADAVLADDRRRHHVRLTAGTLPTCYSSTQGQLSYVTNGVASPTYRASVSTTGSTLQLVGCDGSGWTYH